MSHVESTVYRKNIDSSGDKIGESRVSAVKGTADFAFSQNQCRTICGEAKFGIPPMKKCSPVQFCCKGSPKDPREFFIAAARDKTIYAVQVVNQDSAEAFMYSSTRDRGRDYNDRLSGVFSLVANPEHNTYEVRATEVFLEDGARYDADDFVLCSARA